jgi:hypothetical protein
LSSVKLNVDSNYLIFFAWVLWPMYCIGLALKAGNGGYTPDMNQMKLFYGAKALFWLGSHIRAQGVGGKQ